jgi:hypothetical protein
MKSTRRIIGSLFKRYDELEEPGIIHICNAYSTPLSSEYGTHFIKILMDFVRSTVE